MRVYPLLVVLVTAMLTGCVTSEKKATELLDTARFEEKQNNFEHAAKLYDEIIRKHPNSPAAKDAAARLDVLKTRKP